jgi:hypothetical protein
MSEFLGVAPLKREQLNGAVEAAVGCDTGLNNEKECSDEPYSRKFRKRIFK